MQTQKDTLDFMLIGAQKAGTTSLLEYLKPHPEIYLPPGLEAPYFNDETARRKGWESYLSKYFSAADPALTWGKVTTHYMFGAVYEQAGGKPISPEAGFDERTVPQRIYECIPEVRLIAILRDPVKRAQSHHQMTMMNGYERRSFDDAIGELLRPECLERSRRSPEETTGYVVWGEYGRLLKGYLDIFPAEQILVVFTDELKRDPGRLLRRIHEFLGVTSDLIPENLGTRYREGGTKRRVSYLDPKAIQGGVARNSIARMLWHALPQASRRWIDRSFAGSAYRIDLWNRSGQKKVDRPSPETLVQLREHFASDADLLAVLFGDLPPWHTNAPAGLA